MAKTVVRNLNLRFSNILYKHTRMQHDSSLTPYKHIAHYEDPVLHKKSEAIPREQIKSTEVQELIKLMVSTTREHRLVGLAAPQIGVSKQVIVMEFTERHLHLNIAKKVTLETRVIPLKIFINPKLIVTDSRVVKHEESCASISRKVFVPRAYGVEVTGKFYYLFRTYIY